MNDNGMLATAVHRALLREFFASAVSLLAPGGELHLSLIGKQATEADGLGWKMCPAANAAGLRLVESVRFVKSDFPEYHQVSEIGHGKDFPVNKARTFVFRRDAPRGQGEQAPAVCQLASPHTVVVGRKRSAVTKTTSAPRC